LSQKLNTQLADLDTILANQRALGKRFLWLLIVPFIITITIVIMFFFLMARLTDVGGVITDIGGLAKQLAIERYLVLDNNYTMAIHEYEQLDKTQENASLLARLGVLYFELDRENNKNKAIQKLEMAKQLDPTYWETYRNLTYIYVTTGDTKNAIEAGEQALKLNKYDARTYNNLAWAYATSKEQEFRNLERAEEYALKANMLAGGRLPDVLDTLAEVYLRKGGPDNRKRALNYLREAISLAPNGETRYQDRLKAFFPDEKP
jgi:tetratricopeptide (TPR) repeat protein